MVVVTVFWNIALIGVSFTKVVSSSDFTSGLARPCFVVGKTFRFLLIFNQ